MVRPSDLQTGGCVAAAAVLGLLLTPIAFAKAGPHAHHGRWAVHHSGGLSQRSSGHLNPQDGSNLRDGTTVDIGAKTGPKGQGVSGRGSGEHGNASSFTASGKPNTAETNWRGGKQDNLGESAFRPAGPDAKAPPGGELIGKTSDPVETHTHDTNSIDTRITIQPPRIGSNKHETVLNSKFAVTRIVPKSFATRIGLGKGLAHDLTRNAIGEVAPQHPGDGKGEGLTHVTTPAAPAVPISADRVPAGGAPSIGRVDADIGRSNDSSNVVRLNASPPAGSNAAVVNHGAIDGSKFMRPNIGGAVIGGPSTPRTIASINGTTIRPRHY